MKKILRILLGRAFIVSLLLITQLILIFMVFSYYNDYFVLFQTFNFVLSILALLYLINSNVNPSYKIIWVILIFTLPIFGLMLYLMFGGKRHSPFLKTKLDWMKNKKYGSLEQTKAFKELDDDMKLLAKYAYDYSRYPVYKNTKIKYFKVGEEYKEELIKELKKAKKFIFMEYFIIEEGVFWNEILDILKEKVNTGVDVRVIYDDFGCIQTLPSNYYKRLTKLGIKCSTFNKFIPILSSKINNRDHRKITVIDGKVAFTGGINLADEYINEVVRFGHWKDNGIKVEGEAVFSMTVMFLNTWDYINGIKENYENFKVETKVKNNSYIIPYDDSPYDHETVGRNIYLHLIARAKKYIYIVTPYLILDNEFINALSQAAKSGVEVKILVPGIADKVIINEVTKFHYEQLLMSNVKIYEYEIGFTHAKTFIVDDLYSIVGTVNLDYRSLYLHFENAVLMYKDDSLKDIKFDFITTLKHSKLVTLREYNKTSFIRKIIRAILNIFSPLL